MIKSQDEFVIFTVFFSNQLMELAGTLYSVERRIGGSISEIKKLKRPACFQRSIVFNA